MEDENNQNGHKKLIPPPFKIKILTDPPYRIDLSKLEKKEDSTVTQQNSNFVQAQVHEESSKLVTTQNPGSTPSATTDANPSATKSEYALVKRDEILPSKPDLSFMQQQPEQQMFFDRGQQPFQFYNEADARKLAYEYSSAFISVNKTAAEESLKTRGMWDRSQIAINEDAEKMIIAVNKERLLNESKYKHEQNMNSLKATGVVEIGAPKNNDAMTRYITDFIHDFQIVALAVEYGDKSDFYCLDISRGIKVGHSPINEKALENLFKRFLREVVGEAANSYKFSDLFVRLKDLIPLLGSEGCDLAILKKEEQIFKNGIYNVREKSFYEFKGNERIFGQFPINVKFVGINQDVFPATVFDKILNDVFDGDMDKICLLYQILGAIMSNISLKHIFVFQGRHNCGKTTLTDILSAIIGSDKCQSVDDWSNLSDYTQEDLNACKLVVVTDASDRPITPKQLSLLKNFADGTQSRDSRNFKLIINTNNAVYTDKDSDTGMKHLSNALASRLVVLPFEKEMSKTYSKVDCEDYMEHLLSKERERIISTAFVMFSQYYAKGENNRPIYQFCHEFRVNEVIDDAKEVV